MKPRRFPLWLSAGLGLAIAGFIAWCLVRKGETSVALPGSGEVVLLGTTYGVEHRFSDGSAWVKLVRPWISPKRVLELGLRNYLHQSPGTNLVIWTHWRYSSTNQPSLFASVMDDRGTESVLTSPIVVSPVLKRAEALVAWQFNSFPRRLADIRLRFYDRDPMYRPQFLAEMMVPNPVRSSVPAWEGPRAPVTVKSGEFEFTLTQLASGGTASERLRPGESFAMPRASASFVVSSKTMPDRGWRLRRLEGVSATGNSFAVPVPQTQRNGKAIVTGTYHVLWPEDGAWRITAEFSQESGLLPDQTWTFRNVPLRPGSPTVLSNLAVTVQGITLTNLEVSMLHATQLQPSLTLRNVKVDLRFTPSIPDVRVDLIEAVDKRGRRLDFNPSYDFPPGTYSTLVGAPSDPESVDLTFAIRPSHTVEFLVTPTFMNSNAPSTFPKAGGAATNYAR